MKNFIKKMVLMFMLILGTGLALFAQGAEGTDLAVPTFDIMGIFATFGALVAAIPLLVEMLRKLLTQTGGKLTQTEKLILQIVSWVVGVALAFFGWYFNLGFLSGLTWYYVLMYGVGASLAANGVADTKLIKALFALFQKKG